MTSAACLPLEMRDLGFDRREQVEIAGDEARGARAHAIGLGPLHRPADQGLVEAKREIVVAGEIDVRPPLGADDPRIARRDRQQRAPQALAGARIEKGLVPAFACRHDPVLAKGSTSSNRNASPVSEILKTANPINGKARLAETLREPEQAPETRHDWSAPGGSCPPHRAPARPCRSGARSAPALPRRGRGAACKPACRSRPGPAPRTANIARNPPITPRPPASSARRCSTSTTSLRRRGSPGRPAPPASAWARPGAR